MKNNAIKTLTIMIFSIFLIVGCDNNSTGTTPPESATISGTITFTGTWPTNGTIAVSLSSTWPPAGAPAASKTITYSDLSNNTYAYTFENVTFGSYGAIAVSWEDPNDNNPASNQHTLGAYGGVYPFIESMVIMGEEIPLGGTSPTPVTVSDTQYTLTGIDITANLIYAIGTSQQ